MTESHFQKDAVCAIVGASHAGVNCAFMLRKEGWQGQIVLYDSDPLLPYHRPPLSKTYLCDNENGETQLLKPKESYDKENIALHLGVKVVAIDKDKKQLILKNGASKHYDKLVLAVGGSPFIPPIKGLEKAKRLFTLRSASDADAIRGALQSSPKKQVVIIGGGYIGLEVAASLQKMGASVTVLEREPHILSRVTAAAVSDFFMALHRSKGVRILTQKQVVKIRNTISQEVICEDGERFKADIIIVGTGIKVNTELAESAGIAIENGIKVSRFTQTSDPNIYAIGDGAFHYHKRYGRHLRIESVQNAIDQAKVAAANICGKAMECDTLPWFWSDQYDVKLQMVGLSLGYDRAIVRKEPDTGQSLSVWYFKNDQLIAVDAINHAKAYVIGTKLMKTDGTVDQSVLKDVSVPLQINELMIKANTA